MKDFTPFSLHNAIVNTPTVMHGEQAYTYLRDSISKSSVLEFVLQCNELPRVQSGKWTLPKAVARYTIFGSQIIAKNPK